MAERRKRPEPDALTRAVGLLARREHSARELKRKLEHRGFESEAASAALSRLAEQGLQDDGRFAEMLVRTRIGAGHGPQRIRAELETHGLDEAAIARGFEENRPDWPAEARRVVQRRFRPDELADAARRRKAIDFLLRRGFDLDVARAATVTKDPSSEH